MTSFQQATRHVLRNDFTAAKINGLNTSATLDTIQPCAQITKRHGGRLFMHNNLWSLITKHPNTANCPMLQTFLRATYSFLGLI